ncbi:MAG: LysM peptidoglycan-binding domain-containing protein [Deltaproteobacteria bacterium]
MRLMIFRHVFSICLLAAFASACAGTARYSPQASSNTGNLPVPRVETPKYENAPDKLTQEPAAKQKIVAKALDPEPNLAERPIEGDALSQIPGVFAKGGSPSLFLVEPDPDIWKAYYYFFYLKDEINADLRDNPPQSELDIPVVLNYKVERFLDYFQNRGRVSFRIWLSRSGRYLPMMREILDSKGLPQDLVYLAMIESGFSVSARSHKGAVGPWQFIAPTAKRYGLRVDDWVDERMDPEKSTVAAANYLSDLYGMFSNWELAAAGYNAGEERVRSAIAKYEVSDFWEISEYTLPRETREYVPKLMAALIIARNLEKYGFDDIDYHEPKTFEKVLVPSQVSLADLAKAIGVDHGRLKDLNPSLRRGATPPGGDYQLNVPVGYASIIRDNHSYIASIQRVSNVVPASESASAKYRVRRGDTLTKIAARHGVSLASLKKANRIKGPYVKIGRVITIPSGGRSVGEADSYVAEAKPKKASSTRRQTQPSVRHTVRRGETLHRVALKYGVSVDSLKEANNIRGTTIKSGQSLRVPGVSVASAKTKPKLDSKVVKHHNVRSGDTLWNIANKYEVSVSDIKNWNNLRSSNLALGDRLTIYVK